MQLEEYKESLQQRYLQLGEEEKEVVRNFKNTEASKIFSYLLGPELSPLLSMLREARPMQETAPVQEAPLSMAKGGLVERRKKPVAKKK